MPKENPAARPDLQEALERGIYSRHPRVTAFPTKDDLKETKVMSKEQIAAVRKLSERRR